MFIGAWAAHAAGIYTFFSAPSALAPPQAALVAMVNVMMLNAVAEHLCSGDDAAAG